MRKHIRILFAFMSLTAAFCFAVLSLGGVIGRGSGMEEPARSAVVQTVSAIPRSTVILDAGHGGEDGGAVSSAGAVEKSLNLSIVRALGDLLTACGVDVIYTREGDDGLYDGATVGNRKMTDLKNRLAVRNAYPDALFVSIHMNTFSDPRCHGMQIFYSGNDPSSAALAECLRNANNQYLQPDNTRACKAADASIYLLDRAEGTTVLAECGFLSNPDEAQKLMTAEYREQTAAVLCIGILNYIKESDVP